MESSFRRPLVYCAMGLSLCAVAILAAISIGTHPIRPATTMRILWHHTLVAAGAAEETPAGPTWSRQEAAIV